jgi:hypothetical protein
MGLHASTYTCFFACLLVSCAPATAQDRSDALRPDAVDTDAGPLPGAEGDASDTRALDRPICRPRSRGWSARYTSCSC